MNTTPIDIESEIFELERKFHIKLPNDYREHLIRGDLNQKQMHHFSTKDGKVESIVKYFFNVHKDNDDDLYGEIEGITLEKQIPKNLIPVAITPAGNRVLISISGGDAGKIYYWAWDEEPEPPTQSYKFTRLVADNFNDFLTFLQK